LKIGSKMLIEHILEKLLPLSENIILVVDKRTKYAQITKYGNLEILEDEREDFGPVEGIRVGLKCAKNTLSFVCACDMPLLESECILELYSSVEPGDMCVIPVADGKHHPLHAFYSRSLLPRLEKAVQSGRHKILEAIGTEGVRFVSDFTCNIDQSVRNVNYPTDIKDIVLKGSAVWKGN